MFYLPNNGTDKKYDSVAIYRIRKLLQDLSTKTGRGTELVSLYLPPKKPVHEAISALREESGTASNIKSDTTRNHVQDALTKTMARLRLYKQTPENGIVIFCGAIPGPGGPGNETIDLYEVLPQKPVQVFLYRCLAPETNILLDDGSQATIANLSETWRDTSVSSYGFSGGRVRPGRLRDHIQTPVGGRKSYRLKVESGRAVCATEDHPFFTPKGWVTLADLRPGDLVAINPISDLLLTSAPVDPRSTADSENYSIVDEYSIAAVDDPPANLKLTVKRLKERGLLPLTATNPKLRLLAKLMGHLMSDGSLTRNVEIRNGRTYTHFTVDFCVGTVEDIQELRGDLAKLGVTLPPHFFVSCHEMRFADPSCMTKTVHAKLRDTALVTLLRALGAPIGSKVKNGTVLPGWIKNAPISVQKEFLAAYMGAVGEAPRMLGSNPSSAIKLAFHRSNVIALEACLFAQELAGLFANFGVVTKSISKPPSVYARKERLQTSEIELKFQLTEQNVLKICHGIGYRYCRRKSDSSRLVGEYLRIKSEQRALEVSSMEELNRFVSTGNSTASASLTLNISESKAKQWSRVNVTNPIVRKNVVPAFREWLSLSTQNLGSGLVWESVTSKEEIDLRNVMDLTVDNEDHSFFANGFLVHNCDDHFHLDPLRDMLREQNVIGVLAVDATEAGLGIVSGDQWDVVDTLSSGVSGKTRKGGQCVSSDTLVQLESGDIVEISKLTPGSNIASYNFRGYNLGHFNCADNFSIVPQQYIEVKTIRPEGTIRATAEHRFFTINSAQGISTKTAGELKPGDRVLVTRKMPQPTAPSLATHFTAAFKHTVDLAGRQALREARVASGMTQLCLSRELGLHLAEISQFERGERHLTSEKLEKIINRLVNDPEKFNSEHIVSERVLPEFFNHELLQLFGYTLGDGRASKNRISLFEQGIEVANIYANLAKISLDLDYVPIREVDKRQQKGSRAKRTCFETQIYSKSFVDGLKAQYPGLISNKERHIPREIFRLDNSHLASFIRGLFDAEGSVRKTRIAITMTSAAVIRPLALLLLRFGIVSSYSQSRNRFGTETHTLDISDPESIKIFNREIGFSASDKKARLREAAERKSVQSYLNVPISGPWVDKKAKLLGIRRKQFEGVTNFFHDERGISSNVFSRVLKTFEDEFVSHASSFDNDSNRYKELQWTVNVLSSIAESDLILACVSAVTVKENDLRKEFFDIELPETGSFIGNGFVLHNSARRYERLREMELTDYFNRIADHAKKTFIDQHPVKGLIVSGPGPTKDEFVKDGYLDYRLQNAIVGVLDTGYSGREGVRETVLKSDNLLQSVRFVEEKKLIDRFFREVNSDTGLAIYGIQDILNALNKSAVDTILVNDDVDMVYLKASCKNCGNIIERFVSRSQIVAEKQSLLVCPKCGSSEVEIIERDIVDYLADKSLDSGANVEVISSKTEGGAMLKNFGGISAILRYRA